MQFEFLDHAADMKFKAYGRTLDEAFEHAVLAMTAYMSADSDIAEITAKHISIEGNDYESLLYKLFDELLFLLDTEGFITSKAKIKIKGFGLSANLLGDVVKGREINHIKAATYYDMHIRQTSPNKWEIQAVLDV